MYTKKKKINPLTLQIFQYPKNETIATTSHCCHVLLFFASLSFVRCLLNCFVIFFCHLFVNLDTLFFLPFFFILFVNLLNLILSIFCNFCLFCHFLVYLLSLTVCIIFLMLFFLFPLCCKIFETFIMFFTWWFYSLCVIMFWFKIQLVYFNNILKFGRVKVKGLNWSNNSFFSQGHK